MVNGMIQSDGGGGQEWSKGMECWKEEILATGARRWLLGKMECN